MKIVAAVIALVLSGCATVDKAQTFDGATTWYAFANGFSEANPLLAGMTGPEIIAAKLLATQVVKLTPRCVLRSDDAIPDGDRIWGGYLEPGGRSERLVGGDSGDRDCRMDVLGLLVGRIESSLC